jgi:hypothetical protein
MNNKPSELASERSFSDHSKAAVYNLSLACGTNMHAIKNNAWYNKHALRDN